MLELRHLRSLVALAETGTVSRAADRVHLTQSALSHQLRALDSHYGVAVVKRHGQSVKLTESGQRLVALARSVMVEVLAVLPTDHRFREKRYLNAGDFARETLITYPVPEERIDLIRRVLKPAGVRPARRTTELTVAILQLVASRRGVAALPNWGIKNYVDYKYVIARSIGRNGLWSNLHGATTTEMAREPFIRDFLETARRECFSRLDSVVPVQ